MNDRTPGHAFKERLMEMAIEWYVGVFRLSVLLVNTSR